jgi:hypothetical protein
LDASVAYAKARVAAAVDRIAGSWRADTHALYGSAYDAASEIGATDFCWGLDAAPALFANCPFLVGAWRRGHDDARDTHQSGIQAARDDVDWDLEQAVRLLEGIFCRTTRR